MSADVEVVDSLVAARDVWNDIASGTANIFSTWEWASTWWRHYGRDGSLRILICRDAGRARAVVPLYVWSNARVRAARFIGHGPADELGPVCAREGLAVAGDVLRAAPAHADVDLVLAELLPGDAGWSPRLGVRPVLRESSPSIALDDGWDAYLAGRSRNLREQLRRRERGLRRRYHVEFRRTVDRERLASDLALLFALHRSRWAHSSAFVPFAAFHEDFAGVAFERGWLRLWFLELDGRAVAAWYGFRFGKTECYYQAGRDVSFRDESLGLVLLAHTIREAAADGMNVYRLLRGAEPFKLRLATADAGVETFALGRGVRGGIGRVAAAAALRQGGLRAALRRLGR